MAISESAAFSSVEVIFSDGEIHCNVTTYSLTLTFIVSEFK